MHDDIPASTAPAPATPFADDDLVYVDPDAKTVVGKVEWNRNGNPKSRIYIPAQTEVKEKDKDEKRRGSWRKVFPWGTYRSMKRVFKLEGKLRKTVPDKTLDQVIEKALKEPFWD